MAFYCYCASSSSSTPIASSQHLLLRRLSSPPSTSASFPSSFFFFPTLNNNNNHIRSRRPFLIVSAAATSSSNTNPISSSSSNSNKTPTTSTRKHEESEEVEEEEEEELPWIQEKALDLVEFTGSVTQAIPGPRVGTSSLPWILALPLAYIGITFVLALLKTVRKFNSPKELRRKLVNKNAELCKSIDELLQKGNDVLQPSALQALVQKTEFNMEETLRKYIRYALNEKPFNPDLVAQLIQLRKASMLDNSQVVEILNVISRRIVKDKGPVVMDISGYSQKGFERKLAVQALFGKVYYLSELPEFCSGDSSLVVKETFGVADEDAEKLRMHTLSEAGIEESLKKMVDDSTSEKDSSDGLSPPQ